MFYYKEQNLVSYKVAINNMIDIYTVNPPPKDVGWLPAPRTWVGVQKYFENFLKDIFLGNLIEYMLTTESIKHSLYLLLLCPSLGLKVTNTDNIYNSYSNNRPPQAKKQKTNIGSSMYNIVSIIKNKNLLFVTILSTFLRVPVHSTKSLQREFFF